MKNSKYMPKIYYYYYNPKKKTFLAIVFSCYPVAEEVVTTLAIYLFISVILHSKSFLTLTTTHKNKLFSLRWSRFHQEEHFPGSTSLLQSTKQI